MIQIQRYTHGGYDAFHEGFESGEWVKYDDHKFAIQEREAVHSEALALIVHQARRIGQLEAKDKLTTITSESFDLCERDIIRLRKERDDEKDRLKKAKIEIESLKLELRKKEMECISWIGEAGDASGEANRLKGKVESLLEEIEKRDLLDYLSNPQKNNSIPPNPHPVKAPWIPPTKTSIKPPHIPPPKPPEPTAEEWRQECLEMALNYAKAMRENKRLRDEVNNLCAQLNFNVP